MNHLVQAIHMILEEGRGERRTFLMLLKSLAIVMIKSTSESPKQQSIAIKVHRSSSHTLSWTGDK